MSHEDPLGSIAEEASKLFASLADWARSSNHSAALGAIPIATGAAECIMCPICQTLHVLRGQKPEVFDHLQAAAIALALAAKAAFEPFVEPTDKKAKSEHIDISFETDSE